ncbi:MAG TPA: ATP-binding protein [Actinomycetales bacterium]|nr:ATP-binding protein [Actinomycetales bacterium]
MSARTERAAPHRLSSPPRPWARGASRLAVLAAAVSALSVAGTLAVLTAVHAVQWGHGALHLGRTAVATVALAVVCGAGSHALGQYVVPRLDGVLVAVQRLALGESGVRAPRSGPDEVRRIADGVNALAEQTERLHAADRTLDELRQRARELDRRMREHLHPDAVADEAVNGLGPLVGADRLHVRYVVDGSVGPVAAQWVTPGVQPVPVAPPSADHPLLSWHALRSSGRRPRVVVDVLHDRDSAELATDPLLTGLRAFVVAPVVAGSEVLGVLVADRRDVDEPWSAAEVSLVESVADDMGRAVQHARLFEQQSAVVSQLRELDRTKSDFLSTISHELRTPLTSIAGYVEMVRDGEAGDVTPMQTQMLDVVARNTRRLRDLIEDVLILSRVESGTLRTERLPVALRGVIDHAVTALRPQAAQADVRLDVIPASEAGMLLGDAAQLEQVMLNLVGNAIKFTPAGGRVTVSLETAGAELVLRVEDTGIGVPSSEVDELFQRFFRASNAKAQQITGTGLGLAIVASIVAAHEGRVEVDSRERRGTTFTVVLPRASEETLRSARPGAGLRI